MSKFNTIPLSYRITEEIRVVWNRNITGGFSAFAEEEGAGYVKGELVARIPAKLTNMPASIRVLPKNQSHAV